MYDRNVLVLQDFYAVAQSYDFVDYINLQQWYNMSSFSLYLCSQLLLPIGQW